MTKLKNYSAIFIATFFIFGVVYFCVSYLIKDFNFLKGNYDSYDLRLNKCAPTKEFMKQNFFSHKDEIETLRKMLEIDKCFQIECNADNILRIDPQNSVSDNRKAEYHRIMNNCHLKFIAYRPENSLAMFGLWSYENEGAVGYYYFYDFSSEIATKQKYKKCDIKLTPLVSNWFSFQNKF